MINRVELPGENWAEIIDPWETTHDQARPLRAARLKFGNDAKRQLIDVGEDGFQDAADVYEAAIIVFCTSSWGGPHLDGQPINAASLAALASPVHQALSVACAPVLEQLLPKRRMI